MSRYIQKNFEEAKAEAFPAPYDNESWEEYEAYAWGALYERNGIWRVEDDGGLTLVSTDGGEPEDNSFVRDGSWIVGELNRAYEAGFEFGYNKGEEQGREDAYMDANESAWQEGYDEGYNEGHEIGFEEGIEEARDRI